MLIYHLSHVCETITPCPISAHLPMHWMKLTTWTIGIVVAGYTIAYDLSDIFQCVPISAQWDPETPATCLNINLQIMILGTVNMFTNITIFVLPIVPISKLKLPTAHKWQLVSIFLVGGV